MPTAHASCSTKKSVLFLYAAVVCSIFSVIYGSVIISGYMRAIGCILSALVIMNSRRTKPIPAVGKNDVLNALSGSAMFTMMGTGGVAIVSKEISVAVNGIRPL